MRGSGERGAATVEHAGLSLLVAVLIVAAIAALADAPGDEARRLGTAIARKVRCAAVGPGPCWRDPLTEAYGRELAGAVRALAPAPVPRGSPAGPLLPVDFRRCRSPGCALPGPRSPRLTASNRLTTAFVEVEQRAGDEGAGDAAFAIRYWEYRPTLGWERIERRVSVEESDSLASTPLLDADVPALVPLETLAGANHVWFPPAEDPPWRWRLERL